MFNDGPCRVQCYGTLIVSLHGQVFFAGIPYFDMCGINYIFCDRVQLGFAGSHLQILMSCFGGGGGGGGMGSDMCEIDIIYIFCLSALRDEARK